jgi:POT family proton-dependent oligopeptide transporter
MSIALIVFRAHKREYKHRTRDESQYSLLEVFVISFGILRERFFNTRIGRSICPRRSAFHELLPSDDVDDDRDIAVDPSSAPVFRDASQALHLLPLMAFFPVFWMLYDQQGSVWTLQASRMNLHGLEPEQLQFLNPLEIMIFLPLFDMKIYPWLEHRGINILPLRRMEYGMLLTAVSFGVSTILDQRIQNHDPMAVSVAWQIPQITILTIAEILLNVTGLEFAYSQAPANMQAFILSLYLFMTAIGDGLGALLYGSIFAHLSSTTAMLLCSICMLLNMFCFAAVARSWKPYNHDGARILGLELGPVHNMEHQH